MAAARNMWIIVLLCVACTAQIDESNLKIEILKYWNINGIDDVVITDVAVTGRTAKASASLVIFADTLREHIYTFEKFQRSWKVTDGPGDDATRIGLFSFIAEAKVVQLKKNMYALQLAVESFAVRAKGVYPTRFDTRIKDIHAQCDPNDSAITIRDFLPPIMRNPYSREDSALCLKKTWLSEESIGSTGGDWTTSYSLEWAKNYAGKAVYVPIDIRGEGAHGYIIRGSTDDGWISLKLRS